MAHSRRGHSRKRCGSASADTQKKKKEVSKDRPRSRSRRRRRRKKEKEKDDRDKDKDTPHFRWQRGMCLGPDGRYKVQQLLGDGTFGRVLGCLDTAAAPGAEMKVAVKVIKGVRRYAEHAQDEAEVLREIQRLDEGQHSLSVKLLDTFLYEKRHFCLVFETLATSIRDFIKANGNRGLFIADVHELARQFLSSLAFLHSIGLTHTDLKCRNVMLRDGRFDVAPHPRVDGAETRRLRNCQMVVIDFGGAVFEEERHGGRVGTRQYRAPEVILGLPWDETFDLWSAGCIIAMFYLGQRPFSVHEDMEHLAMMERLLGMEIPSSMVQEALEGDELPDGLVFGADKRLAWPASAPEEEAIDRVLELRPLREQVLQRHGAFATLLEGLLTMDPKKRLLAVTALRTDPFITGEWPLIE